MSNAKDTKLSGTVLIHGDITEENRAKLHRAGAEVSPSISVTTTYRSSPPQDPSKPEVFGDIDFRDPAIHVYSRYTQEVSTRAEHILSLINNGYALTYASGLAASYAALVFYKPKRVAIRGGYFGCHQTIFTYRKSRDSSLELIDLDDEFKAGDLCWLETPVNPTGESRDIKHYADKIHNVGGKMLIDATFGPPPLQYPFDLGADCILHSGTKYFGGHSDMLCGVLVVKNKSDWEVLWNDRTFLGSMMGSLEAWLLLRSLKTFHLRIREQSSNATKLVQWLHKLESTPVGQTFDGVPGGIVEKVHHSSLQGPDVRGFNPAQQMPGGFPATFSIILSKPEYATILPFELKFFTAATSLGGVESLIEPDPSSDPRLLRISVGVEDVQDLINDLRQGLNVVIKKIGSKL